jgi:hypothetical protein
VTRLIQIQDIIQSSHLPVTVCNRRGCTATTVRQRSDCRAYKLKYLGRPSDQFFKGYETMLYFTNSLFAKSIPVFNSFKINPVLNTSNKSQIDYQENKNLYFFRKQNGQIKTAKPYTY